MEVTKNIVLTKPFSLRGDSDSEENYTAPNLLQRILSLFKNVRPGSDLTRFQLPPLFNFPKSQLQCYGESVYSTASDLLSKCNTEQSPIERLISVVAWSMSTTRPPMFGLAPYNPILGETHHVSKGNLNVLLEQENPSSISPMFGLAPYNPILGETHHVSKGNLNVLLEQVSHHPAVSALHATDEKENIEIIWCQYPFAKFNGTSVEAQVQGKRKLKLLNHGETYEMNSPNLFIRILPVPGTDWVGNVNIRCKETGLVAELCYISQSFFGFGGNRRFIKGNIIDSLKSKILYKVNGHWDSTVTLKDTNNGEERIIYDAKKVISRLQTPSVNNAESVCQTESAIIWSELSQAIINKDWEKAREAKKIVEEKQREIAKERESKGETWIPKHFILSQSKEGDWDCLPIQKLVPPSPIVTL